MKKAMDFAQKKLNGLSPRFPRFRRAQELRPGDMFVATRPTYLQRKRKIVSDSNEIGLNKDDRMLFLDGSASSPTSVELYDKWGDSYVRCKKVVYFMKVILIRGPQALRIGFADGPVDVCWPFDMDDAPHEFGDVFQLCAEIEDA